MFQLGLPCYLGLNSGRSVSINVNKMTRKHFSRNIHGARMFPQCFPVSHTGNNFSSVSFCFQDANYAYATPQGILTKIRACEHSSNFCAQFEQRPNFASTFNWMGPFDTPYMYAEQDHMGKTTQQRHKYTCLWRSSLGQPQISQSTLIIDNLMHFLQGVTWPRSTWIHIPDRRKSAGEPGWTNVLVILFTSLSISWPAVIIYDTNLFSCVRKMVYCIWYFCHCQHIVKS